MEMRFEYINGVLVAHLQCYLDQFKIILRASVFSFITLSILIRIGLIMLCN